VILLAINAISCAFAWTGVGAGLCAATTEAEEPLQNAIDNAQRVVDEVLKGLSAAQAGVAAGMPLVAEARAVATANENAPTVHGGLMVSASLVPGVDFGGSGSSSTPGVTPVSFAGGSGGSSGGGPRLGLPVQEDDFKVLCDHAGRDVAGLVLAPFAMFGIPTSDAQKYAGGVIASMSGYFCGSGQNETPKRVYEGAKNGDDYFGVWSFAWGDLSSQTGAARGVETGAWNQLKARPPADITKIAFAKAEFYYDVRSSGAPAKWGDYKDDAMWNLRWRARMRRVRPPGSELSSMVASVIGSNAGSYAGSWLGGASEAATALGFVASWPSSMTSAVGNAEQTIGQIEQGALYFTVVH
jgi:hypothetical protein